jgi:hypothetical protein
VWDKRRAHHCMLGYQIEDGCLYRIGDGKSIHARPHLECVTQEEAVEMARIEHKRGGHFGRDLIKISLLDRICSPWLDKSIMTTIVECGRCKAFGGNHLAALLEPITCRHPWELMVGDYMSMPLGKAASTRLACSWMCTHRKYLGSSLRPTDPPQRLSRL